MNFELSEDQSALVHALQAILRDHNELPQSERFSYYWHDEELQSKLEQNGFLDAGHDMGALEGAIVINECAKNVTMVEAAGRGLVAPIICPDMNFDGPVALTTEANLSKAIRNLPLASKLLIKTGEDVLFLDVEPSQVVKVDSIYGYPYGRFASLPDLNNAVRVEGAAATMTQYWRIALAAEIAGAARSAIDYTLAHVKERHVFGRPVGSFQSVQHRLVQAHGHARATYYLAMRAAWSGDPIDADNAACFAQQGVKTLVFDLHQFNGGMGVTTEWLLHFWLYRIRALQAETGGPNATAVDIARRRYVKVSSAEKAKEAAVVGG